MTGYKLRAEGAGTLFEISSMSCTRNISGGKSTLRGFPVARSAALPLFPSGEFGADFVRNIDTEGRHKLFHVTLALRAPHRLTSAQNQLFKDISTFRASIFVERHCFSPSKANPLARTSQTAAEVDAMAATLSQLPLYKHFQSLSP